MTAVALNLVNDHTQKSAPRALSTILMPCHDIILAFVNYTQSPSMLYTFKQLLIFLALERLSTS